MSSNVSRFTLKGMFLMTIAVGMISSSAPRLGVPGVTGGACMVVGGGDPPEEDRSELLWGDSERLSPMLALSSHCCMAVSQIAEVTTSLRGQIAHRRETPTEDWPILEGRLADTKRAVLGLRRDGRRGLEMIRAFAITA